MKHSYQLDNYELENINDCLFNFEKYFKIELTSEELSKLRSFEAFCDLVKSKMNYPHAEHCTSQIFYYQLRNTMLEEGIISNRNELSPKTPLNQILKRASRRRLIKKLEHRLGGIKLNIFEPPQWFINLNFYIGVLSIIILFFSQFWGVIGIVTVLFMMVIYYNLNILCVSNIRGLVNKVCVENYLKIRRFHNSINPNELNDIIVKWFSLNAGIEETKLKNATF